MKISFLSLCSLAVLLQCGSSSEVSNEHQHHKGHEGHKGHHHHHHHRRHHHGHRHGNTTKAHNATVAGKANGVATLVPKVMAAVASVPTAHVAKSKTYWQVTDAKLVTKMKELEQRLTQKQQEMKEGHILVNGPLPADFSERFSQAVAHATGTDARNVTVLKTITVADQPGVVTVDYRAPGSVVAAVKEQSGDENSKLATGNLRSFLVDKNDDEDGSEHVHKEPEHDNQDGREGGHKTEDQHRRKHDSKPEDQEHREEDEAHEHKENQMPISVPQNALDIDTAMPYGELEPFGREDTAQELTEDSITESNQMVDQLERAEVAEEKRAVFRALTRLRGAAITSFDGVARSQTGNIDEYNKIHQWRKTHPLHHLADEESDVSKWAFPDNADF